MNQKTTMKKLFFLQYTSCDAIKEKLEKMALEGWKLKSANIFYEFEKINPQKLKYDIDFFPQSSAFSTRPEGKSLDYLEYCKGTDWKLAAMNGNMHIFVSENENATPIQTDEKLKFDNLNKSIIKQNSLTWFILPILFLFDIFSILSNTPITQITKYQVLSVSAFASFIIMTLIDLGIYLIWKQKNSNRLKSGKNIKYINLKSANKLIGIKIILFLLILIIPAVVFSVLESTLTYIIIYAAAMLFVFVITLILNFWQKKKFNRIANIVFPLGFAYFLTIIFIIIIAIAFTFIH